MRRNTMNISAKRVHASSFNQIKVWQDYGLVKLFYQFLKLSKRIGHNLRTRKQLSQLSDVELKDIGITKADVYEELKKHPWQ